MLEVECINGEYPGINKVIQVEFCDFLTPAHKLIFLKYIKLNGHFIQSPENYPKLIEQLSTELNRISNHMSTVDWVTLMKSWIACVKEKAGEAKKSRKGYSFAIEDFELLNLVDADKILVEPSSAELSCILDHLEIAYSSPKVWLTITLELEAIGAQPYKEEQWKKIFERWCNKVKRKKEILDDLQMDETEKNSFLNPLEQRFLDFLQNVISIQNKKGAKVCRVCLDDRNVKLKEINELTIGGISIAQKICECANVEININDVLPQHICEECINLLEEAYRFKNMCERSDRQLRNANKSTGKEEYVEYVISKMGEEINIENLENLDEDNNAQCSIEINLSFEDDGKQIESKSTIKDIENIVDHVEDGTEEEEDITFIKEADAHIHQCEICGIICYNQISLKKHMHSHTIERPHQCDICQKEFKTKLTLRVHMRSHTGERPYVCEVCGKSFTQDCTLSYHRSIHTGEKKYLCNVCDYRARNVNDLKVHMRTHTGARPYRCTQCPAKFTTSSNLQKHLRRHTGVKDFQTCGKAFKTWSAVTNHRAIHSEVKMFQCQHCPYRGSTKANLQIHNRTHTRIQPYACDQCPLRFSTASNRNKHIRNVHEKLKLHQCGNCGRSFFSRESARKHMVIHTGLKPYTCTECPMAYGWYNGLQKHMKTQHPGVKMPTEKHFLDIMEK